MNSVGPAHFAELLRKRQPFIDVRAPVEFTEGTIPGAVNLPLLENDERAAVGTTYKREGSEAAVALGHRLVHGSVKEARIRAWMDRIEARPDSIVFCFRGGLRSQIAQRWLSEAGVDRPIIEGGYKALRRFLLETLARGSERSFVVVAGATGSGKTEFLRASTRAILDLEKSARHRGSAFGAIDRSQPSQIDFENDLAVDLLNVRDDGAILVEDESRMIGQRVVPEKLFFAMKESPLILLEESPESRIALLLRDYVENTPISGDDEAAMRAVYSRYQGAVNAISKKLGGLRTAELLGDLRNAQAEREAGRDLSANREWIRKLLEWYYDPMYERGLAKRGGKILFRGTREAALEWWTDGTS